MSTRQQSVPTGLRSYAFLVVTMFLMAMQSNMAWGHATGESYVWINLQSTHLDGRFEVRLEDLRNTLGLEIPADHEKAVDAVLASSSTVQQYLRERFSLSDGDRVFPIEFTETQVLKAKGLGHFAQYFFRTAEGDAADHIMVESNIFFEQGPFHRTLLLVEKNNQSGKDFGEEFTALVFSPANNIQTLDFNDIRGLLSNKAFVWQGMLHIWIGYDHILFLLTLLLPAVLVRRENAWLPVGSFREAFWNTVKIVTVFTVAHSITLSLAALEIVQFPTRFVESTIALSIILVALNNIYPLFRGMVLWVVLVFGLFHGLGFASVMGELPFRMQDLIWVILAFNVGVEIGQIAIVMAVVPLLFWLRNRAFYQRGVLVYGSAVLAAVAAYWFVERAFGLG